MSTSIRTNFDFNLNQIIRAVLDSRGSAPTSPVAGQVYYDTGLGLIGWYNGNTSAWVYPGSGGGSVTSVSVTSANGFSGTVATATSTPAITIATTITGLLKGNGTAISAATAGTDYLTPSGNGSALTGITNSQVSGSAPTASPTFTGTVAMGTSTISGTPNFSGAATAPTASALTDNTQIATTAYTDSAVAVETSRAETAEALLAPKASPTFTGTVALGTSTLSGTPGFSGAATALTATAGTNTTQIATTAFVQTATSAAAAGLDAKPSVAAASTANLSLSGTSAVDGVTIVAGSRILAKNQTTTSQNGLWVAASGAWTRPTDFASASTQTGTFVFVEAGTANANSGWFLTGTTAIVVDTTAQTWVQFSGAGELSPGTGISISSNTISVSTVPIANGGTGQTTQSTGFNALSPLTTVGDTLYGGTSGAGTRLAGNTTATKNFLTQTGTGSASAAPSWGTLASGDIPNNAANTTGTAANVTGTVAIANGGTGAITAAAARTALAVPSMFQANNGSATTTTWPITHGLGNSTPQVIVYDVTAGASAGVMVMCDVTITGTNTLTLGFATAMVANQYNVTVIG